MFQFGKLAIQSTVSLMGTAAIAAQGMANLIENLNGILAIGVGVGLMTVVGESLGAGRKDEAIYYVKKLSIVSEVVIVISCLVMYILVYPITKFGGMEAESARLCIHMVTWITIVKPVAWVFSFIPAYGFRAAGDVKFTMTVSVLRCGLQSASCNDSRKMDSEWDRWRYGSECLQTGLYVESFMRFG